MMRNIVCVRQIFGSKINTWVKPNTRCLFSSEAPAEPTKGEKHLMDVLKTKFPGAKSVQVSDISGGCGAMYQISVEATEFKGKRTVQQHRMINEALSDEIKEMHGLQINTKVPDS